MKEQDYEKLLNIKTSGDQKVLYESLHYNRYEPTSYEALEILTEQYNFTVGDSVVDFGCGKGRINFYLNHFFYSTVTGIEMNKFFYEEALDNKKSFLKINKNRVDKVNFVNCLAERYEISSSDNKFYFFNPFSMQIFAKVVKNILVSLEKHERPVDIILYYPSDDFIFFLESNTPFLLVNEIKVPNLCTFDSNFRFLIYRTT